MAEVASEEFVADAPDAEGGAPTSMEKEPIEDGAPVGAPPPPASPTSRAKASAAVDEQDAVIAMLMEKNKYGKNAFCCLPKTSPFRQKCFRIAVSSRFDMFILFFILLNALLLAIVSYDLDCVNNENVPVSTGDCYSNLIVERAEIIFTVVFAFEMFVKIFAFGFYSGPSVPGTYMKDMWSWLDFVVVISSFVAIIMKAFDTEFINLSVLRIFRVLRPLKSVSKLPKLKRLLIALGDSIKPLATNFVILMFVLILFSILGVQFFLGYGLARCRLTEVPIKYDWTWCREHGYEGAAYPMKGTECWEGYMTALVQAQSQFRAQLALPEQERNLAEMGFKTKHMCQGDGVSYAEMLWTTRFISPPAGSDGDNVQRSIWSKPQDCFWPTDDADENVCSMKSEYGGTGMHMCPPVADENGYLGSEPGYIPKYPSGYDGGDTKLLERYCGSNWDPFGQARFTDHSEPYDFKGSRMILATYLGGLNFGYTTFNHFFAAMLSIGQAVTQEGWVDIMYMYMDSYDPATALIVFFALILLGAFVMLNLMLAVITNQIESTDPEEFIEVIVRKNGEVQAEKKDPDKMKVYSIIGTTETTTVLQLKKLIQGESEEDIPPAQQKLTFYPAARKHDWSGPDEDQGGFELEDTRKLDPTKIDGDPVDNTLEDLGVPEDATVYLDFDTELISASTRRKMIQAESTGLTRMLIDFVESNAFNNFIWLCIIVNTLVLGLDQHPMDPDMDAVFGDINMILTVIFLLEMIFKLAAFGPKEYVKDNYNVFDGVVVFISVLEWVLEAAGGSEGSGGGLSALRAFRIFRVFKMAKNIETMQTLLVKIVESLKEIVNFGLLLCLFIYIYALIGMQFFANKFHFNADTGWKVEFSNDKNADVNDYRQTEIAVSNFDTFLYAVVTIFQVLTGENWNTVMYDARRSDAGPVIAYLYFFTLVLLGVFMVMNIFLAILLSNFENSEDLVAAPGPEGAQKNSIVSKSIKRASMAVVNSIRKKPASAAITPIAEPSEEEAGAEKAAGEDVAAVTDGLTVKVLVGGLASEDDITIPVADVTATLVSDVKQSIVAKRPDFALGDMRLLSEGSLENKKELEDTASLFISKIEATDTIFLEVEQTGAFCCLKREGLVRQLAKKNYTHWAFDNFILVVIVISSICLACDNPFDRSSVGADILKILDYIFLVIFVYEFLVKVLYFGFIFNGQLSYMHSSWNLLDLIIVVVGLLDALTTINLGFLRALRTIRVLRPLRMISRRRELKLVMDALLSSVPSILNVLVVCVLFFLIFAIVGVNSFKGRMQACQGDDFDALSEAQIKFIEKPPEKWSDMTGQELGWLDGKCTEDRMDKLVKNRFSNPDYYTSQDLCQCWLGTGAWDNVVNGLDFDNVANAFGTLYEISTTEGWVDVLYAGIDGTDAFMQPIRGHNKAAIIYFILFMLFGAFFVMQLFVGVIIERFNAIREENEAEGKGATVFATVEQKLMVKQVEFIHDMKMSKKIIPWNQSFYDIITLSWFDPFIMGCIILNAIIMALTYLGMSEAFIDFLTYANYAFAIIFFVEMCLKLLALGRAQYFRDEWNWFDFMIVWGTNIGLILEFMGGEGIGSAASVVRMFRIGRILRLFNSWPDLKRIIKTILSIGPALSNVTCILGLLLMIYAVLGVQLFAYYELNDDLNSHAHFQNIGMSAATLFRYLTGENWNGMMHSMMTHSDECVDGTFSDEMEKLYGDKWETKLCTFNKLDDADQVNCVPLSECGNAVVLVIYFYSFTLFMTMVMLNLFIGIILDAFGEADDQVLTDEQLASFVTLWEEFDPMATGQIPLSQLKAFMQRLKEPMGFGEAYVASQEELEDAILGLGMSIRKEEVAAVEALGAFGDLQLNSYDVAIALAKRVGKNMGKLETNPSKADVGIRIDVNSKNRGTIIGFEEDRHLILLDGDEEGKYFNLKLTNCMLYGREIVEDTPGQKVEFIGPRPGQARSEKLAAMGINKGMIGKLVKVDGGGEARHRCSATVEFDNGTTAEVELEKLALSPFVKAPAKEDEFHEVYHRASLRKGFLTSFVPTESGPSVVTWEDGEMEDVPANELLAPDDKCYMDIGGDHTLLLKSDELVNAAPILKKYFSSSRQPPPPAPVAEAPSELSEKVENFDASEEAPV